VKRAGKPRELFNNTSFIKVIYPEFVELLDNFAFDEMFSSLSIRSWLLVKPLII